MAEDSVTGSAGGTSEVVEAVSDDDTGSSAGTDSVVVGAGAGSSTKADSSVAVVDDSAYKGSPVEAFMGAYVPSDK